VARAIRRYWVLSGAALCAVLGGPIAVAQASDNTLRVTLNSYAQKIPNDAHAVKAARTRGQLVRALGHEVTDLRSLKRKLAHESASSARGRTAKSDLVTGLGLIANAYAALRRDVQAAHGGPVPVSKVNAARRTVKKGRGKFLAGLHLLS
jgi:hypothetical protein